MHFSLYLIVNLLLALCLASELDYDIGLPENTHPPGGNSNGGELAAPKLPGNAVCHPHLQSTTVLNRPS